MGSFFLLIRTCRYLGDLATILCSMGISKSNNFRGRSWNLKNKSVYGSLDLLYLCNGGFGHNHGFDGIRIEGMHHSHNLWVVADLSKPVRVHPIIV